MMRKAGRQEGKKTGRQEGKVTADREGLWPMVQIGKAESHVSMHTATFAAPFATITRLQGDYQYGIQRLCHASALDDGHGSSRGNGWVKSAVLL